MKLRKREREEEEVEEAIDSIMKDEWNRVRMAQVSRDVNNILAIGS